jgi:hypothetical protein
MLVVDAGYHLPIVGVEVAMKCTLGVREMALADVIERCWPPSCGSGVGAAVVCRPERSAASTARQRRALLLDNGVGTHLD